MPAPEQHLAQQLEELHGRCRDLRRQLEVDPEAESVPQAAKPRVARLLGATVRSLETLADALPRDPVAREALQEIVDVAWVSRGEVLAALQSFREALAAGNEWQALRAADIGLERAEQALRAADARLRARTGQPPPATWRRDLADALEVRRHYVALRRSLLGAGHPTGSELRSELWAVATRLDAIGRLEAFRRMRIDDRRELKRLRDAAQRAANGSDADGGRQPTEVWSELLTFSRLLLQVHDREELRRHDRDLLRRLAADLAATGPSVAEEARRSAAHLLGRDADLDAILLEAAPPVAEHLAQVVARLADELERRHPGP